MARTDVQLMLDVKAGDDTSFELLLERYRRPLVNYLGRMLRDAAAGEDLAQEVFLRVYRARKRYEPSAKFTTWLFRIATNLALNAIRDGRARRHDVSLDETLTALGEVEHFRPDLPDPSPDVVARLVERDRARAIRREVFALPPKQRAAVLLHKYHGLDYDEIARILDCSVPALKSLLFRAYEALRVALAPFVKPA